MDIKFNFKVLSVTEEKDSKCYVVQCSYQKSRRVIKAHYDGSVYIPDYQQQLAAMPDLDRTILDIQLASFILKKEKRKV
ncbi:hypothetical protein V8V54_07680 [Priestia megaterium]|uniref:hypothetical protein n=1 Tax=Priestia megaterium TaxID=1404 RepID=UPI000BF56E7C|nr:hypothetical protein [Priestia megaterium]MCM3152249.1 hypothetical protein [Priestia megaterium]PFW52827.1 hypothetical protein COL17_01610 [Priestia megaterium]